MTGNVISIAATLNAKNRLQTEEMLDRLVTRQLSLLEEIVEEQTQGKTRLIVYTTLKLYLDMTIFLVDSLHPAKRDEEWEKLEDFLEVMIRKESSNG